MEATATIGAAAGNEAGLARAYNVAYRISGSEEIAVEAVQRAFRSVTRSGSQAGEREVEVGTQLLMETRKASYELLHRRGGAGSGVAGSSAAGSNGNGSRPTEQATEQEQIRDASMRLPEHQREALALRELGE